MTSLDDIPNLIDESEQQFFVGLYNGLGDAGKRLSRRKPGGLRDLESIRARDLAVRLFTVIDLAATRKGKPTKSCAFTCDGKRAWVLVRDEIPESLKDANWLDFDELKEASLPS